MLALTRLDEVSYPASPADPCIKPPLLRCGTGRLAASSPRMGVPRN